MIVATELRTRRGSQGQPRNGWLIQEIDRAAGVAWIIDWVEQGFRTPCQSLEEEGYAGAVRVATFEVSVNTYKAKRQRGLDAAAERAADEKAVSK